MSGTAWVFGGGVPAAGELPPHAESAAQSNGQTGPGRHIVVSVTPGRVRQDGQGMSITGIPRWGSSRPPATPVCLKVFRRFRAGDLSVPQVHKSARGSPRRAAWRSRGGGRAVPGGGSERARRAAQARRLPPMSPPVRCRERRWRSRGRARPGPGGSSATASIATAARSGTRPRPGSPCRACDVGRATPSRCARSTPPGRQSRRAVAGCGPPPAHLAIPSRRQRRRASPSPSHRRRGSTSRGCPRPTTSASRAIGCRGTALGRAHSRDEHLGRRARVRHDLHIHRRGVRRRRERVAAGSISASTAACPAPTPCTGVAVRPGDDLEALAATKPVATVFCIAPGTYRVHSEIRPRDGQQFIGTGPGVVITGGVPLAGFAHSARSGPRRGRRPPPPTPRRCARRRGRWRSISWAG